MVIFEFSDYWNTIYFIGMISIAFIETALVKKAIKYRNNGRNRRYKNWLIPAFLILVFFETFRTVDTGVDTVDYVGFFQDASKYGFQYLKLYRWEPLFTLYVFLISKISNTYNILFFINSIIETYAFLRFVTSKFDKNSTFIFLPLFILNYSYNLSSMRSSLGTAFLLLSIVEYDNGKNFRSITYSIVATLFHYSFIFQVCFIIYQIHLKYQIRKINRTELVLFTVSVFFVTFFSTHILQRLFNNTRYVEYTATLGTGWIGQWNIVMAGLISLYILKTNRNHSIFFKNRWHTDEIMNILNVAFLPFYVRLNIYRVPTYYLLCRIVTYTHFGDLIRKKLNSSGKAILKAIEFIIMVFGMLFYATRLRTGMEYTFIWSIIN